MALFALPLDLIAKRFDELGIKPPFSVEILSAEQRARPLADAARLAHDTSRAAIDRARAAN